MMWQSIETAPKDGCRILVVGDDCGTPGGGRHYAVVNWTQDERTPEQRANERGTDFSGWYADDDDDDKYEFLTHWMHLPRPPEQNEAKT